jgi:hypothetical protein
MLSGAELTPTLILGCHVGAEFDKELCDINMTVPGRKI